MNSRGKDLDGAKRGIGALEENTATEELTANRERHTLNYNRRRSTELVITIKYSTGKGHWFIR
jgi:hypothetical protein